MVDMRPGLDRLIARQAGVRAEVSSVAGQVEAAASARLAAHRRTGEHQIATERPNFTDVDVVMTGAGAVSVEYGRDGYTRPDGTRVGPMDGLRIMRGSAEDVAG